MEQTNKERNESRSEKCAWWLETDFEEEVEEPEQIEEEPEQFEIEFEDEEVQLPIDDSLESEPECEPIGAEELQEYVAINKQMAEEEAKKKKEQKRKEKKERKNKIQQEQQKHVEDIDKCIYWLESSGEDAFAIMKQYGTNECIRIMYETFEAEKKEKEERERLERLEQVKKDRIESEKLLKKRRAKEGRERNTGLNAKGKTQGVKVVQPKAKKESVQIEVVPRVNVVEQPEIEPNMNAQYNGPSKYAVQLKKTEGVEIKPMVKVNSDVYIPKPFEVVEPDLSSEADIVEEAELVIVRPTVHFAEIKVVQAPKLAKATIKPAFKTQKAKPVAFDLTAPLDKSEPIKVEQPVKPKPQPLTGLLLCAYVQGKLTFYLDKKNSQYGLYYGNLEKEGQHIATHKPICIVKKEVIDNVNTYRYKNRKGESLSAYSLNDLKRKEVTDEVRKTVENNKDRIERTSKPFCRSLFGNTKCPYKDRCTFAHTIEEANPEQCRFGNDCKFAHMPEVEKRCRRIHKESVEQYKERIGIAEKPKTHTTQKAQEVITQQRETAYVSKIVPKSVVAPWAYVKTQTQIVKRYV